jgi:HK97 family phage major capsid protein
MNFSQKLKEVRESIAAKQAEYTTLMAGELTAEVRTSLDNIANEVATLKEDEKRYSQAVEIAQRSAAPVSFETSKGEEKEIGKMLQRYKISNVINAAHNKRSLTGVEAEFAEIVSKRNQNLGIEGGGMSVPAEFFLSNEKRAALSATGQTSVAGDEGGRTIEDNLGDLIMALEPYMVLNQLGVRTLGGLRGNLALPREATSPEAAIETETGAANNVAGLFELVQFTPQRIAGYVPYTYQLLAQSSLSVETYARERLLRSIANKVQNGYINGAGSTTDMEGIFAVSGTNAVTFGGASTWAKIVEMESGVDSNDALMGSLGYLTNSKVRGQLKTTSKDSGSGLFLWNSSDVATPVNGYQCAVTNQVADDISGSYSGMVFGNFAHHVLANWGDVYITTETNAKAGTIEVIANTFWDSRCLQPKSFSVAEDIVIAGS